MVVTGFGQSTINDPFFDKVAFRGAFGTSTDWTAGWANWNPQSTVYGTPTVTVSGELTSSTTWTSKGRCDSGRNAQIGRASCRERV